MDIKKFFTAIPRHAQTLLRVGTTPDSNVEVVGEDVKEKTEKRVTSQTRLPILPPVPYQPRDVNCMPVQRLAKRTLCFQRAWFDSFPWLHFDANVSGVLCFTCAKAACMDLAGMARYSEDTFVSKGFCNWKKAIEKFKIHEKTSAHMISHSNLKFRSFNNDVDAQLSTHHLEEQTKARNALLKIVTTVQYLAQQGLAIRGKESSDGNFMKLLELRSNDDVVLQRWLTRTTSYTSVAVQNELLKIMAHMVLRNICKNVGLFAVIVDGTQDIQGVEQEAICVRYIDDAYDVHEDFIGLYSVSEMTGASLSNMLQDALLRLNLPITHLRAQTYDGASNMSGKYQGCQALIKKVQPLANYTHCGAHITHLICAKAIESAPFLRDALNVVQELGGFYNSSGKFKNLYLDLQVMDDSPSPSRLKPLCPTCWLSRGIAVRAVLSNYTHVLEALNEASSTFGSSTADVMVCHVHRNRLAECTARDIAIEFVDGSSDTRLTVLVLQPIAGLSEEKPVDSVLDPPELQEQWREFDNEHADLDYGSTGEFSLHYLLMFQ
ncbi:zinc finger MYM-type protein 1-like [Gigantopelta aegis]|uniref:zinc finger MYM-type protein 1-like n=1 Tax=Gigantopelta aegis TaxID=1735272 RepID=UPI001B88808E|nr:zinc finger MYM-type protein 1-like [Gigantopelta aegis]